MADSQGNGASNGSDTTTSGGTYQGPRAADPPPVDTHHDDPEYITRTRFLTGVAVAGGGVLTAAILVPVVGFAVAPTVGGEDYQWVDIGPLSDFPDGQTSSIAVSGPDPEADRRVFLRRKDGAMTAIWNRCSHLGCPVNYSAGSDGFACPCHGGAYDSVGRVTAGPPPRPLDRFDVKVVDAKGADVKMANAKPADRVLIGKPYSIDSDENPYELSGPGEPVDGVLANLYPL